MKTKFKIIDASSGEKGETEFQLKDGEMMLHKWVMNDQGIGIPCSYRFLDLL